MFNLTTGTYFRCTKSGVWIHWSQYCNKVVDCEDASDETNCQKGRNASHTPTFEEILKFYPSLKEEYSLFEDFMEEYYDDHMFGRVSREDPPDWYGFIAYSKTADYSDLENVLKLTKDEVKTLGHQKEDFILDCTFDEASCSARDFLTYQDDEYGNCFGFNHLQGNDTVIYTTKSGSEYGLKLILYTEQDEYISLFGRYSGARVVIKPPGFPAIPASEGFTVSPGTISSVGIREKRIKRKPDPYGNCRTEEKFQSIYGDKYSQMICEETCVQAKMFGNCGCVDTMLVNATRCMLLNREQGIGTK
ncbi:amiloride-sensitive sodium channel subunit alpha-like [Ptychodera flava]|uniref:amiloride-sensitive sodium channel subunit alpha-like n=1 Tax=Ptychodera flava TaxID=63121 RepID=UPI00396A71AE